MGMYDGWAQCGRRGGAMKVVVEFLESGRFRDNVWDGEFGGEKGEHRAVSPWLAAQVIHNRQASLYHADRWR
ncbi:hypothetical protein, partial [Vibrio vulnificus]|uniref:hypothetical protein n=1 Tax=Vibrio vulnificus TaxID=672 RepID=UPI001EEA8630